MGGEVEHKDLGSGWTEKDILCRKIRAQQTFWLVQASVVLAGPLQAFHD